MTKNTTQRTTEAKTKRDASEPHGLSWTGVLHTRQHRWWWYVGLVLVAAWLARVAIAAEAWSALPVIAVCTVALIMYARSPERSVAYSLGENGTLTEGTRSIVLADFKCFDLEEQPTGDAQGNDVAILLVPAKFYAPGYLMLLPDTFEEGVRVIEAIEEYLPYRPITDPGLTRVLNRLIRWVRIV